jgi:DMSO/TMAO reductase YedYZ heme-binding membrane subunit
MSQLFWKTLQLSTVLAVLFSNVHYQWTPNGYAAGIVALLAALFVTAIPVMFTDFLRLFRRIAEQASRLSGLASPSKARLLLRSKRPSN